MIGLPFIFGATAGNSCDIAHGGFLGFPTWYEYLKGTYITNSSGTVVCDQSPQLHSLGDFWLIVAAVIEILLRIAGIAAVIMVIYGGVSYVTSQGEPDKTHQAQGTIVNALIGLAIAIAAAAIVAFIAGSIS